MFTLSVRTKINIYKANYISNVGVTWFRGSLCDPVNNEANYPEQFSIYNSIRYLVVNTKSTLIFKV